MELRFVVTGLHLDSLVFEGLLDEDGLLVVAGPLPAAYIHVVLVIAGGFAVGGLVLFAEVGAA